MVKVILILLLAVMHAEANELNGSFESGTYVSPSGIFSCNLHNEKLMVDLDSLSDNYNEDKTELVKFSSSTSDVYINYWYSLAPKNAVFSQIEDSVGTDDTNLALLFTQLEEAVLNDVFLLNLTQVKQESIFVNNGIAQLKVYLAEFEDKVQHVSSIAWISDKYIITSVVLPLDMYLPKSQGILDPIQLGDLAKVHLHSCKLSTN